MKTLILSLFAALVFSLSVSAQSAASDFNWNELKSVQKAERDALHNRQDSELKLLLEIQKTQLSAMLNVYGGANPKAMYALAQGLASDRREAIKNYADERRKMNELQTQERIAFKQRTP